MTDDEIKAVTRSLMLAGNFGDVHDQIIRLHQGLGIPAPEGDFLDGWTDADFAAIA